MMTGKLHFVDEDAGEDITKRKSALRTYAKKLRAGVVNRDVKEQLLNERFDEVYEAIFKESIGAGTRRTFFVYLSFSSEASTQKLISRLLEYGHTVVAPRVENREMQTVKIEADSVDYARSAFGALEPLGQAYTGEIDVAVIPFLAVDANGNRLGYGGGYYDSFLRKHPEILRVAFGFDCQVLSSVPTDTNDEKVACVVTEKRSIFTKNNV